MSNSAYWTEIDSNGYERRVRECKNDGCSEILYYDEEIGRYIEFESGEQHSCKYYQQQKKQQQTGSPQGNRNQSAQNTPRSPQSSNKTTGGPVHPNQGQSTTTTATIEILLREQVEELRRAVDHLSRIAMFAESMDFRLKKIEECLVIQDVPPPRPDLSDTKSLSHREDSQNDI